MSEMIRKRAALDPLCLLSHPRAEAVLCVHMLFIHVFLQDHS